MKRFTASALAGSILGRAFSPRHLWRAIGLQRYRKRNSRSLDDVQLKLYSEILPSDFLHFGFFDDVDRLAEDTTLNDVVAAQRRYAELLLDHIIDHSAPVLDVGCGMGGMCRLLLDRGFNPVALSPDRLQVSHVKRLYPDIPVVLGKLENLPATEHEGKYGTVVTSESLQYLKLDRALPVLQQILRPSGRWVACDFFYREPSAEKSCHEWQAFNNQLVANGWRITYERDITANVLPTLRFVHMWATRFGIPFMHFAFVRFRKKQPGLHHLCEKALSMLERLADHHLTFVDARAFEPKHQYMLLVIERAPTTGRLGDAIV